MDGEQTLIAHSWDTISRSAVDRLAHRLSVILAKDNEEKVRSEMVRVITAWDAAAAALRRITSRWKSGLTARMRCRKLGQRSGRAEGSSNSSGLSS